MNERHLVVTGPMGVGKSTLMAALARRLDRPQRDSDADLRRLFGDSGRVISVDFGVDVLHRLEAAVLLGALAEPDPQVVSGAGSVVEDRWCRVALARRAFVIVLTLASDDLVRRMAAAATDAGSDHRRAMDPAEVEALAHRRRPLYDEVADLRLDASVDPEVLADRVLRALAIDC